MIQSKIESYSVVAITEHPLKDSLLKNFLIKNKLMDESINFKSLNVSGLQEIINLDEIELKLEGNKVSITSNNQDSNIERINSIFKTLLVNSLNIKILAVGINFNFSVDKNKLIQKFEFLKDNANNSFLNFEYVFKEDSIENRLRYYVKDNIIKYNFNNHFVIEEILLEDDFIKLYKKSLKRLEKLHSKDDIFILKEHDNE